MICIKDARIHYNISRNNQQFHQCGRTQNQYKYMEKDVIDTHTITIA